MSLFYTSTRRWLVEHPAISAFEWAPGRTFAASPEFVAAAVISYLSLTFLLCRSLPLNLNIVSPLHFRFLSAIHNLILLLLSALMATGCSLSALSSLPTPRHLFCLPTRTSSRGPLFFWAYVFYLSKILEFIDTLLILISPSKKPLTFLHVYHHATVVVMCYLWLAAAQSLFPIALVTNATVHTVMYAYYFLCSLGRRPLWKRAVTDLQIVQFVFSFAVSVALLWYHFVAKDGGGCSGMKAWLFNAGFNASLLGLFVNFHLKSYGSSKKRQHLKTKRSD